MIYGSERSLGGGRGGRDRHGENRFGRSLEIGPRVFVRGTVRGGVDTLRHVLARDLLRWLRGNASVPYFRIPAFPPRGRIFHIVRPRFSHEEPIPIFRLPDPPAALRSTRVGIRSRLDTEVRDR